MNGSYRVPTGSRRSPNKGPARPSAASIRNRLFSAIPSSTCWPARLCAQTWAEATRSALNTSACSRRLNTLRRLTQAPRLVDTVTSGEVVMIRAASSESPRASSPMARPNASWVDARRTWRPIGSTSGTGTGALT